MALNAKAVHVGRADQLTTGMCLCGAVIATVPADIDAALTAIAGFDDSGYVSEDGLSLSTDFSTNDIKEMNGATVRKILESFDGTISLELLQLDYESACQTFGEEYVTKIAATTSHGEQLHIGVGAHLPANKAWAFKLKDGDFRCLLLVPNGQVTNLSDITFAANDAIKLPVEVSCYDDGSGTGNSLHIYTDDGVFAG